MKVAFCVLNGRIAPKYYDSAELLYVVINEGRVVEKNTIAVSALEPDELCDFVSHLEVDVVVCGGLRVDYQEKLRKRGIKLIYNVIGNVEEVVEHLVEGRLHTGDIINHV